MSKITETALKLLESLPESAQQRVVDALRHLVQDAGDEERWDELFGRSSKLVEAARQAKQDIAEGKASDMDYERL